MMSQEAYQFLDTQVGFASTKVVRSGNQFRLDHVHQVEIRQASVHSKRLMSILKDLDILINVSTESLFAKNNLLSLKAKKDKQ